MTVLRNDQRDHDKSAGRSRQRRAPSARAARGRRLDRRRPVVQVISDGQPRLASTLGSSARAAGWTVTQAERPDADVAIALSCPPDVHTFAGHDVSVAVVADEEERWARSGALDAAKRVVCVTEANRARVAAAWGSGLATVEPALTIDGTGLFDAVVTGQEPHRTTPRIGVATCARSWDEAEHWGDTYFARGLMRALRRLGYDCTELVKPDWRSARALRCDVVIHLRGLARRPVVPGQTNVLWIISHPERVERDEIEDYDIIASASRTHAERLSAELDRPVHFLPQATDIDTFQLGHLDPAPARDVVYVGSARWPRRRAPRWLVRNGQTFRLYGRNWAGLPEAALVVEEFVPNRDLARVYGSAGVVVTDHHGTMRVNGFVGNRIFDVLASGGVVISDEVDGLGELFGETVRTYREASDLQRQTNEILTDPALRRRLSHEGRALVRAAHTLDHRAVALVDLLLEHDGGTLTHGRNTL